MREIGLGEEVLNWKIIMKTLRNLKVNVRKLAAVRNSELENWWENILCSTKFKSENWCQKLLSRNIGICEKIIQSWKITIKHFKSDNWCKKFQ